mmetsp:Transcript_132671/g.229572  ORF Transcript_132671/g.229572 Transcript_132671/m.229572 type:complete len:694 (+) Transcript_132671:72-2153(+)
MATSAVYRAAAATTVMAKSAGGATYAERSLIQEEAAALLKRVCELRDDLREQRAAVEGSRRPSFADTSASSDKAMLTDLDIPNEDCKMQLGSDAPAPLADYEMLSLHGSFVSDIEHGLRQRMHSSQERSAELRASLADMEACGTALQRQLDARKVHESNLQEQLQGMKQKAYTLESQAAEIRTGMSCLLGIAKQKDQELAAIQSQLDKVQEEEALSKAPVLHEVNWEAEKAAKATAQDQVLKTKEMPETADCHQSSRQSLLTIATVAVLPAAPVAMPPPLALHAMGRAAECSASPAASRSGSREKERPISARSAGSLSGRFAAAVSRSAPCSARRPAVSPEGVACHGMQDPPSRAASTTALGSAVRKLSRQRSSSACHSCSVTALTVIPPAHLDRSAAHGSNAIKRYRSHDVAAVRKAASGTATPYRPFDGTAAGAIAGSGRGAIPLRMTTPSWRTGGNTPRHPGFPSHGSLQAQLQPQISDVATLHGLGSATPSKVHDGAALAYPAGAGRGLALGALQPHLMAAPPAASSWLPAGATPRRSRTAPRSGLPQAMRPSCEVTRGRSLQAPVPPPGWLPTFSCGNATQANGSPWSFGALAGPAAAAGRPRSTGPACHQQQEARSNAPCPTLPSQTPPHPFCGTMPGVLPGGAESTPAALLGLRPAPGRGPPQWAFASHTPYGRSLSVHSQPRSAR